MTEALEAYRAMWDRKPALQVIYHDMFERMARACGPGPTVEIGAGIGKLREHLPDAIVTDIQFSPWLDLVADAQNLPFKDESMGNLLMVDVLHHVEFPLRFLRAAARVLRPGGRLVMIEPAITWGSALFYRFLHQEPVDMSAEIFIEGTPDSNRDPYAANQAIPTLLARNSARFQELVPELRVTEVSWFSFLIYPLSGGFKPWTLVSGGMAQGGLRLERRLEAAFGRLFGFRMLLVLTRSNSA